MAEVVFAVSATDDLHAIYDRIDEGAGPEVAQAYVMRLHEVCLGLGNFPNRGTPRDDLAPGIRTIPFERRAVIAYQNEGARILILRIMHHGRDVGTDFEKD
jgi:toxin ParE1/3/4